jgi:uncharacterized membrane protein YraQ (UPF0718 family)
MVATPETGVDSIGVTLALMGPVMAIARPISAILSAIAAGSLVRLWDTETPPIQEDVVKSCCGGKKKQDAGLKEKLKNAVFYGYGKLLSDFMGWLLVGLGFAALIQTFIPPTLLSEYGNGIFAMLIAVLISIPMYICATASTPIAAGLMLSGVSPGAALVFMLTGPATNIATLMVVKNELGIKSLVGYLTGVIVTALIMGFSLDWLIDYFQLTIEVSQGGHSDMTSLLYSASAVILMILIIWQYSKKLKAKWSIKKATV